MESLEVFETLSDLTNEIKNLYCTQAESKRQTEISSAEKRLVNFTKQFLDLPENILKQDVLTIFYIIGCALNRNKFSPKFAALFFATGIEIKENVLVENHSGMDNEGIMQMKLIFELASIQQSMGDTKESIINYDQCLVLSLRNNDVTLQKEILLRLSKAHIRMKEYKQAVVSMLQLLAMRQDLFNALGKNLQKLRDHWPLEIEYELRVDLCTSYQKLDLLGEALNEAFEVEKLELEMRDQNRGIQFRKANFLLGRLHEEIGNYESALKAYKSNKWLDDTTQCMNDQSRTQLKVKTLKCVGNILLKLKKFSDARQCFQELFQISRSRDEYCQAKSLILLGKTELLGGNTENARSFFKQALKICQNMKEENLEYEVECMIEEADVYGHEGRYSHALYHSECALSLARKSGSEILTKKLELKAALYTQHSTSEKELNRAAEILYTNIMGLVDKFSVLAMDGVEIFNIDEKMELEKSFSALQVVLHRLGENKLSLAMSECQKSVDFFRMKNKMAALPKLNIKGYTEKMAPNVRRIEAEDILVAGSEMTVLYYTFCDGGFLLHVMQNGTEMKQSYLLCDHVVDPSQTMDRLESLVEDLQRRDKNSLSLNECTIYNTKNRSLPPKLPTSLKPKISLPEIPTKVNKGAGDMLGPNAQTKVCGENVDLGENVLPKSAATEGDLICGKGQTENIGKLETLKEIYSILIQPVHSVISALISALKDQTTICVVTDSYLCKVPFDQLVNPIDGKTLGEKFNLTMAPCLSVIDRKPTKGKEVKPKSTSNKRRNELLKSYEETALESLEALGLDRGITGLVTCSATGTNVLKSPRYFTPYKQAFPALKCSVIGCPKYLKTLQLHETCWLPKCRFQNGRKECIEVSQYLDTTPILDQEATKEKFLEELTNSTVIHICTYGNLYDGCLAFSPNTFPIELEPLPMSSYVVDTTDLGEVRDCTVQLAVLSMCHNWQIEPNLKPLKLVYSLLYSGVKCVVTALWPVPDSASSEFLFHFYLNLQSKCQVSRALFNAKNALKERYTDSVIWNAFVAFGSDVTINLREIRAAQTQRRLNETESNVLTLPNIVEDAKTEERSLEELQSTISRLSGCLSRDSDVIGFLLGILEEATERLTKDDNSDRPIILLPRSVAMTTGAIKLLRLLGFDLQSVDVTSLPEEARDRIGSDIETRMLVFPHWNQDGLLLPAHQALTGLHELQANHKVLNCLAKVGTLPQKILCCLIDILSVLHHTPEVELRTSDVTMNDVWGLRHLRELLRSIGVVTVRDRITFNRTLENRSLLIGSLQLFVSVCEHRNHTVVEKIDVPTLGKSPEQHTRANKRLDSLDPIVMPRNEVRFRGSWAKGDFDETTERKNLAGQIAKRTEKYVRALEHAKWWHRDVKIPKQATNSYVTISPDKRGDDVTIRKVKVISGSTPSCNRIPVSGDDGEAPNLHETLRRRQEAREILNERSHVLDRRFASAIRDCYL